MTSQQQHSSPCDLRVLFFAPQQCWPANTGSRLRNYHLARELGRSARVTYLSFADDDSPDSSGDNPIECVEQIVTVPREAGYTPAKLARGLVGRNPLPILNYSTPDMARKLTQLLDENDFDVVQMESLLLWNYLPLIRAARSSPAVLCDWHNIDSEVMQRYADHAPNAPRRFYARATSRRLVDLERRALHAFDAHCVVSERDQARLLEIAPDARIVVIDNGVDVEHYAQSQIQSQRNRIVFVGSMDYHANSDAAVYFAHEIWPRVHQSKPDLIFTIVGRNPPEAVRALADLPGIEVTGTVDDVRSFYHQAIASVVPLRIGGGSRLKILEAMAAGVPVVSTRLGAEGLAVGDGKDIVLADSPAELSRALLDLCDDAARSQRLIEAAQDLVRARYDWRAIGANLLGVHRDLTTAATQNRSFAEVSA